MGGEGIGDEADTQLAKWRTYLPPEMDNRIGDMSNKLVLFVVNSVRDAQMCHGFGGSAEPYVVNSAYLGKLGDPDRVPIKSGEAGITILTEKLVRLTEDSGDYNYVGSTSGTESGIFINAVDFNTMNFVRFDDERDLSHKLHKQDSERFMRGNREIPASEINNTLSANIYYGSNVALYNLITSEDNEMKMLRTMTPLNMGNLELYKTLTALDLKVPDNVTETLKVESKGLLFDFAKKMLDPNLDNGKFNLDMIKRLEHLKSREVQTFVKNFDILPGVTVNVEKFLKESGEKLTTQKQSMRSRL